jgi:hypothetical protein
VARRLLETRLSFSGTDFWRTSERQPNDLKPTGPILGNLPGESVLFGSRKFTRLRPVPYREVRVLGPSTRPEVTAEGVRAGEKLQLFFLCLVEHPVASSITALAGYFASSGRAGAIVSIECVGEGVQPQPEKECEEKARLMNELASATNEYNRTVGLLNRSRGVLSKVEYDSIRLFVEKARKRTEAAHLAVDQHIIVHGC